MNCSLSQLRNKEVINSRNGCRIGYVDDLEVNTKSARVCALIIYGRLKLWGLLGRKDDCVIPWDQIELIGEDTILVGSEGEFRRPGGKKRRFFNKF
ncbi:MAG: YlmC/YmxH family sporulation protein [Ruminococcus sp.]|nr:YlmC/YmxH family sporulation protein [Ruminococcus sp.]